jgi:hypothetical protein
VSIKNYIGKQKLVQEIAKNLHLGAENCCQSGKRGIVCPLTGLLFWYSFLCAANFWMLGHDALNAKEPPFSSACDKELTVGPFSSCRETAVWL